MGELVEFRELVVRRQLRTRLKALIEVYDAVKVQETDDPQAVAVARRFLLEYERRRQNYRLPTLLSERNIK